MKLKYSLLVAALAFNTALAQPSSRGYWVSPGYITGQVLTDNDNKTVLPSNKPTVMLDKQPTTTDKRIAKHANWLWDKDRNHLGMLLIDHGQVVYEQYSSGTTSSTKFFSMSMSKTLTAMTVGEAVCSGRIKSLQDKAEQYSPALRGTGYGNSTIEELLTMQARTKPAPDNSGTHNRAPNEEWRQIAQGYGTIKELVQRNGNEITEGGKFSYDNTSTNSLMLAVDGTTDFRQLFADTVWARSGAEQPGAWMVDKEGQTNAAYGFSATLRDWGRLAQESIEMRKGARGACLQKYMKAATAEHIPVGSASKYNGYGYQVWTDSRPGSEVYLWLGNFGQKIWVDPKNERILVIFRNEHNEHVNFLIARLFADWAELGMPPMHARTYPDPDFKGSVTVTSVFEK